MIYEKLSNFKRGWVVGDFENSIFRRKDVEIAIMSYKKGDTTPGHIHKDCDEINIVVSGKAKFIFYKTEFNDIYIQDKISIEKDEILVVEKNEAVSFEALEDCTIVVIKTNSNPKDKFLI